MYNNVLTHAMILATYYFRSSFLGHVEKVQSIELSESKLIELYISGKTVEAYLWSMTSRVSRIR